jgi:YVTN family beta-propeller protein
VTPDGKTLVVTNTADNTISLLDLGPQVSVRGTVKTGADPFEVIISADSSTAYVSNFLGDSISVVDLAAGKTTGYIRSGKQPAMLALDHSAGADKLWVANTGSNEVWVIDAAARKLLTRLPVGAGAHGVVITPNGKVYVSNSTDNTVTVIDQAQQKVLQTLGVGNNPNGLTYLPNAPGS